MTKKASELYQVYHNPNGPRVSTVTRKIIQQDSLYFKDIDGSGTVSTVNDWRLPARERAAAYAKLLSVKEKIGQLFISDWRMGIHQKDETLRDATGLLDEGIVIKELTTESSRRTPYNDIRDMNDFRSHILELIAQ